MDNIHKIIFNKINYNNYLDLHDDNLCIHNNIYQSILNFLFDDYYNDKNNYQNLHPLFNNIYEVIVKDISFLYIYEKFKIYYSINHLFENINKPKNNYNISFYINDKIMLINNKKILP